MKCTPADRPGRNQERCKQFLAYKSIHYIHPVTKRVCQDLYTTYNLPTAPASKCVATAAKSKIMSNVAEWQQIKGWLDEALAEARLGLAEGGIPIGAVLADPKTNEIVSRGHNLRVQGRETSRKTIEQFGCLHAFF